MSAADVAEHSEERRKKSGRDLLRKIRPDDRIRIAVLFSTLLCCLSRLICVNRIRPQGAAYLLTSYDVLLFALVLLPLGASEALHELIRNTRLPSASR